MSDLTAATILPEVTIAALRTGYRVSETGCWEWTRTIDPDTGYGRVNQGNKRYMRAHVASYVLHAGPVPPGLVLDHLCRVRHCINPDHLEPVTVRENTLRGVGPAALNARKTHCKRGHEFTPENTIPAENGGRRCRTCRRAIRRGMLTLKTHPSAAVLDRDACGKCGREIVQVDLAGRPFGNRPRRQDRLTWWHVDDQRNLSHQAVALSELRALLADQSDTTASEEDQR